MGGDTAADDCAIKYDNTVNDAASAAYLAII